MQEKWFLIIEHELLFYLNFETYKLQMNDRLEEINYIPYPHTFFDDLSGEVRYVGQNVEQYVVNKIDKEQSVKAAINRAERRVQRIVEALNQLSEEDHLVLTCTYFTNEPLRLKGLLGFKSLKALCMARVKALKNLHLIFIQEREVREDEFNRQVSEERIQKLKMELGTVEQEHRSDKQTLVGFEV